MALPKQRRGPLAAADAFANRVYGSRYNPLYQSGTIAVALLLVLIVTGIWLVLFYRIGTPWESVARITGSPWTGRWVRGVHRYASDAAVVATLVHAIRVLVQRRTWGPRALAWLSGVVLLGLLLLCGVTGFVLVWDGFGRALAVETARVLDALPILSEPVSRAFLGERAVSPHVLLPHPVRPPHRPARDGARALAPRLPSRPAHTVAATPALGGGPRPPARGGPRAPSRTGSRGHRVRSSRPPHGELVLRLVAAGDEPAVARARCGCSAWPSRCRSCWYRAGLAPRPRLARPPMWTRTSASGAGSAAGTALTKPSP